MLPAQPNKYLEASIQNATPTQLLIMSYDGAIRFCKQAIESLKSQDHLKSHQFLSKTQDIINEFIITLDRNAPIAEDLLRLYEYFQTKLIEANVKKSAEPAEEVLGFLMELKETWLQAARLSNATKASPVPASVPVTASTTASATVSAHAPVAPTGTAPAPATVPAPIAAGAAPAPAATSSPAPAPALGPNARPAAYGQQINPYRKSMANGQTTPYGG